MHVTKELLEHGYVGVVVVQFDDLQACNERLLHFGAWQVDLFVNVVHDFFMRVAGYMSAHLFTPQIT
jgi:hypothetical protein